MMNESMNEIFAKRLVALRSELGITQKSLAKKLMIHRRSISYYECGNRIPDAIVLDQLAEFFHCTVDYLLGRTTIKSDWEIISRNINYTVDLPSNLRVAEDDPPYKGNAEP